MEESNKEEGKEDGKEEGKEAQRGKRKWKDREDTDNCNCQLTVVDAVSGPAGSLTVLTALVEEGVLRACSGASFGLSLGLSLGFT